MILVLKDHNKMSRTVLGKSFRKLAEEEEEEEEEEEKKYIHLFVP